MANLVVGLVIIGILALSIKVYVDQKKKGAKCVGCSVGSTCNSSKENTCQIKID